MRTTVGGPAALWLAAGNAPHSPRRPPLSSGNRTGHYSHALSGGGNYRLNLPANIPAANFWSVTLYEAENGSGLANGQPFPASGSRD